MIESVTYRNFQKYEKRTIHFGPGVTVICGDTNTGKSSAIRGLEFVLLNRPGYVRDGCPFTSVLLKIDGHKVFRKKGKGVNLYSLDGKRFVAFKTEVPEPIAKVLNVGPVNFQKQLDLPYWFTETPGKVSKNLNEIVNLEVIDSTIERINSLVRSRRNELEVTENRVNEARREVRQLSWVPECHRELEALEQQHATIARIRHKIASAGRLLSDLSRHTRRVDTLSEAILGAEKATVQFLPYLRLGRKTRALRKLVQETGQKERLVRTSVPDFTEVKESREVGDKVSQRRRTLETILDAISEQEEVACHAEKQLKVVEQNSSSQAKKSRVCPTCGRKL